MIPDRLQSKLASRVLADLSRAAGGVLGRKLALVHYDDGSEAAKANSFAKRLLESDKVDVVIGGTTTGATMAMALHDHDYGHRYHAH